MCYLVPAALCLQQHTDGQSTHSLVLGSLSAERLSFWTAFAYFQSFSIYKQGQGEEGIKNTFGISLLVFHIPLYLPWIQSMLSEVTMLWRIISVWYICRWCCDSFFHRDWQEKVRVWIVKIMFSGDAITFWWPLRVSHYKKSNLNGLRLIPIWYCKVRHQGRVSERSLIRAVPFAAIQKHINQTGGFSVCAYLTWSCMTMSQMNLLWAISCISNKQHTFVWSFIYRLPPQLLILQ